MVFPMEAMPASTLQSTPLTPAARGANLPRFAQMDSGHTRLSRRLGPVHGFPQTLLLAGQSIEVVGAPELVLLVDLLRANEGEFRLRYLHDVICQVVLAHADGRCTVNVNLISSRVTPSTEASVVVGSIRPAWLSLAEVDDVVCEKLAAISVRDKFSASINAFISRWVTEYSLRTAASLKDDAVAAAVRARDQVLYTRLLAYLDGLPGANAETISNHLRTALVAPEEIAQLLISQPAKAADRRKGAGSMERTMEIRSERNRRD